MKETGLHRARLAKQYDTQTNTGEKWGQNKLNVLKSSTENGILKVMLLLLFFFSIVFHCLLSYVCLDLYLMCELDMHLMKATYLLTYLHWRMQAIKPTSK